MYLVTRVHGLKRHLLTSDDYVRLLKVGNNEGVTNLLSDRDYSTDLNKFPPKEVDAYLLENIVYQKLSDRFTSILQIASGKIGDVLKQYYRKLEVENLKKTIRSKHENVRVKENQLIPIARKYQTVNFPALLEARNMPEMIYLLSETPYSVLKNKLDFYNRYSNPLILEAATDSIYYQNLWKKIEDLQDKDYIEQLIGTEIDLKNLLLVFASKQMNMDRELFDEMVMKTHYRLQKSMIEPMFDAQYRTIPELLRWQDYVELAKEAVDLFQKEMFTEIENSFSRHVYSNAETTITRKPNSLVYVFAYLSLCFKEARNLTTLSMAKQMGLNEEKTRNLLFI